MTQFNYYTLQTVKDEARPLFESIQQGYGFIPNLFAYMAEAPTTVDAYLKLNDLVKKTSFTMAQQQVALLAVSVENQCDFCTVAHRAIGKMSQAKQQTLDAIYKNEEIENPIDRALVNFVKNVVRQRGHLSDADIDAFLAAGFTKQQVLEVMLIVSIKTLSNYINHLTLPEPNEELLNML